MNYFAHARKFLDDPYFVAGVSIPDWMNVVDRKVRVRTKHARPWAEAKHGAEAGEHASDDHLARIATGVIRHHRDDAWFHETRAFVELSMRFSLAIRDCLPEGDSWRTGFLGHILVELLLDAELIERNPDQIVRYYATLKEVDPEQVSAAVLRMTGQPVPRLAELIPKFIDAKFLCDYADDEKLLTRINQVLARVRLEPLPPEFLQVLPTARREVALRREELLAESRAA